VVCFRVYKIKTGFQAHICVVVLKMKQYNLFFSLVLYVEK